MRVTLCYRHSGCGAEVVLLFAYTAPSLQPYRGALTQSYDNVCGLRRVQDLKKKLEARKVFLRRWVLHNPP